MIHIIRVQKTSLDHILNDQTVTGGVASIMMKGKFLAQSSRNKNDRRLELISIILRSSVNRSVTLPTTIIGYFKLQSYRTISLLLQPFS